jgi:hypothetical protein
MYPFDPDTPPTYNSYVIAVYLEQATVDNTAYNGGAPEPRSTLYPELDTGIWYISDRQVGYDSGTNLRSFVTLVSDYYSAIPTGTEFVEVAFVPIVNGVATPIDPLAPPEEIFLFIDGHYAGGVVEVGAYVDGAYVVLGTKEYSDYGGFYGFGEDAVALTAPEPAPCPPFWQAFLRSREIDLCGGPEPEPEPVSITGYVELATGQVQANPNFVWAARRYVQDGLAIIDVNFRDLHKTVLGTAYDIETGMNGTATQILAMPTGWDTPEVVAANPAGTILNVLCKLESDGTVVILTLALSTPFDLDTASVSYSTVVPIVSDLIVRTFFFTDEGNKIWTLQRFSRFIEHSVSAPYEAVGMTPTGRELDIDSDVSAYDAVMVGDTDLLVADTVGDRVARFELTVPGDLESAVYKEDLASNTAPILFVSRMVNYPDLSRVEFAGGASIFSYGPPA